MWLILVQVRGYLATRLESGLHVIGVEPNDAMRKIAEQSLKLYSRFQSIKATAEHTTLKENSVDLVTVAQAFHWFDKEAFKIECQRILKKQKQMLHLFGIVEI